MTTERQYGNISVYSSSMHFVQKSSVLIVAGNLNKVEVFNSLNKFKEKGIKKIKFHFN